MPTPDRPMPPATIRRLMRGRPGPEAVRAETRATIVALTRLRYQQIAGQLEGDAEATRAFMARVYAVG